MATEPKRVKKMTVESINKRVRKMVDLREEIIADGVEKYSVKLQAGNSKTGKKVYTVSRIPIADCPKKCARIDKVNPDGTVTLGCGGCGYTGCYDIQNVCFQPNVQMDRAKNSAIHKVDPERYWWQVEREIVDKKVEELRINIGGDLAKEDMELIAKMAVRQPQCEDLFFSKEDDGVNDYLDTHGSFPKNVHPLLSMWPGMEIKNPHNLPESHLLWLDGTTTLPDFTREPEFKGRVFTCTTGNCTVCKETHSGCWALQQAKDKMHMDFQILYAH